MTHSSNVPQGSGPAPSGNAAEQVAAPAICLIVAAVLGIAGQLFLIVNNAVSMAVTPAALQQQQQQQTPEGIIIVKRSYTIFGGTGAVSIVFNVIAIGTGAFVIFAAIKMKNLQSIGLAKTGAIISMLPCLAPCCLLGLPFGIWSLIVLAKPEVQSAFR